jgi:hypothetical protein
MSAVEGTGYREFESMREGFSDCRRYDYEVKSEERLSQDIVVPKEVADRENSVGRRGAFETRPYHVG